MAWRLQHYVLIFLLPFLYIIIFYNIIMIIMTCSKYETKCSKNRRFHQQYAKLQGYNLVETIILIGAYKAA